MEDVDYLQLLELRSVAEYRAIENCQEINRLTEKTPATATVAGVDYIGLIRSQGFIKNLSGLVGTIGADRADRHIHSPF